MIAESTLIHVFLESPFWLALATAPILFVLWGVWYRTRTRAAGWALLLGLLTAPLLFVLQALVRTDRETLEAVTQTLSDAVQRGDIAGIVVLIDPAAEITGVGGLEKFRQKVTDLLETHTVQNNSIFGYQIEMHQDRAALTCGASCVVRSVQFTQTVRSRWRMEFALKDGRWLITDVAPLDIAGMSFRSISDIP